MTKKKDKQRSKEHIHKIKGRVTWTPLKLGVNSSAPEGKAVPTKYAFVSTASSMIIPSKTSVM
jgi:hypothetical protein